MKRRLVLVATALGIAGTCLGVATFVAQRPIPEMLPPASSDETEPRFLDRDGRALSVTYRDAWNVHDRVPLHRVPTFLQRAFITAEDKRFEQHDGPDWWARANALVQNVRAMRPVRGASTITEQVVRMLHPRPRTIWSRWVEGFEAARLESRFAKSEILEFYLNQVPYARERRGVQPAARMYFDRDLETLNEKEMMALAVLVRSPSRLDLHRGTTAVEAPIARLAERMLEDDTRQRVLSEPFRIHEPGIDVDAAHFVGHVRGTASDRGNYRTTLDTTLQERLQAALDREIGHLSRRGVSDGAILVVNHETDEVLAWVNGGGFRHENGGQIDMVTTPRQPGSTLKPFLYALALEKGWTAATILKDEPLQEAVGRGLHHFRNYSRSYYGPIRVREALGNSLNVPAVLALQHTGREPFYERLRRLGIVSLNEHPDFYGDGLALGNGEVSLLELVRAYATLARGGVYRPLRTRLDSRLQVSEQESRRRVLSPEVSSLVSSILSDPEARSREFGRTSVLELPVQTAVKTGTSNDYRDAWVFGFSHRYTVGVWMGNLDRRPMRGVTGAVGPALVLRTAFAELHRHERSRGLPLSRRLRTVPICRETGALASDACPRATEWFRPELAPTAQCQHHGSAMRATDAVAPQRSLGAPSVARPVPGLELAMDPRIPDERERFAFELAEASVPRGARVAWYVNGKVVGASEARNGRFLWKLERGEHRVSAQIESTPNAPASTEDVRFSVR